MAEKPTNKQTAALFLEASQYANVWKVTMFKKIQIIGVGAIILNKKGEILLTQRREQILKMWDKKWGIPGGHLEFGENSQERVHKEMKEELSIRIKIVRNTPFLVSKTLNLGVVRFHGLFFGYLCSITSGTPKISNNENYDFQWIKPEDINFRKCIPTTSEFIHQFMASSSMRSEA